MIRTFLVEGIARDETARFVYGRYPPIGAINDIRERQSPVGTIVMESGPAGVGQWVAESRNIGEDDRKAFGEDPPMLSSVAVMTDTDNTNESAVAWFGDIVFTSAAA